jgi:hypothetical protein
VKMKLEIISAVTSSPSRPRTFRRLTELGSRAGGRRLREPLSNNH